jgi:hypothetical protein
MKGFRKSTRIAYWVLRALAISSALLLFSIVGIVALQPASHASGLVITVPTTPADVTSSPADMTPTPTPTPVVSTPTPTATNTPQPTAQPTKPPVPTPTPIPKKPPVTKPTATPTVSIFVPIVVATATPIALGPVLPPATHKGTPKVTPGPTPSGSPTTNPSSTPMPTSSSGNTGGPSTTQQNSNGGMMATLKPLIVPIAGVSTAILLGSAGLLGLMFWRKRTATQKAAPAFGLASDIWGTTQVPSSVQPTELAPAQNRTMSPFAMQSIVQYSPFLGAPNTSLLDAPVAPPASDFRPLPINYPQIMEIHTDKTPVPVTPASLPSLSPTKSAESQPALQLAWAEDSSPSAPIEASPTQSSIHTSLPPTPQDAPVAYQFPQQDPLLENLMQQVQMGIFALPGKEA